MVCGQRTRLGGHPLAVIRSEDTNGETFARPSEGIARVVVEGWGRHRVSGDDMLQWRGLGGGSYSHHLSLSLSLSVPPSPRL